MPRRKQPAIPDEVLDQLLGGSDPRAALADGGLSAYHAVRKAVPRLWPGSTAVVQGAGRLARLDQVAVGVTQSGLTSSTPAAMSRP